MANVSLPMNKIADVLVTVPGIAKQKEIIELEKKLVEKELEADKLYALQLTLLENLNQAILQEAVQGKLVPQNQNDEPASELLKRIKTEKATLRQAQGKGKKEKPLPPIKLSEIPFEIPESWVWCRLGEICSKIGSGSTPKGSNYSKTGHPFFRSQNIYDDGLVYDDIKFVSDEVQQQMNGTIVLANDILLNITGGSLGRCAIVPNHFTAGNVSQHVCIIRPMQMDRNYFHKIILSPYFQEFIFSSTTGAGREGLPKYNLEQFTIPIPPFPEQSRIVAEIEKQMAKTKQLKEHIIASQQATEQLLKALLHQAFEVKETV
jgi:type I restriction enzyme S subunit